MPRTAAEEAEYQQLGQQLGFFAPPAPDDSNNYGTGGFAGRTLANILPGAAEKIIQPAQALLGMDERTQVPNFFNVRAPQGVTESIIGGAGQVAQYLPAIIATEGAGATGLGELGLSQGAARIGGAALGFGLPSAPEGPEATATQGIVGGVQSAARDFGWRGKVAAGLLGGGIGYYEGQKQSQQAGLIQGGLNLLGPTLIDPAVDHILGTNRAASAAGKAQEVSAPPPNQASGPIPFAVSPDGPKDIAGLQLAPPGAPPQPGLPFYETPPPLDIGGGRPIVGQPAGGLQPSTSMRAGLDPNARFIGLPPDPTQGANIYGSGNQYDAFAGLQRPPIMTQGETFPGAGARPQGRIFADDNVTGMLGKGSDFTYGRQTNVHDIFASVERIPSQTALSPVEAAARAKFDAENATPPAPTPSLPSGKTVKQPHEKIPTGLQKLLGPDVGWTDPGTPLNKGFTKDAFNLGKKLKTQADVNRAQKMADTYGKASQAASDTAVDSAGLDKASDFANRKQYFQEAVEYATGNPPKAATFRRHDPNYSPNVPHPKWTQMIEQRLDAPAPERGDSVIHWTEQGMPLDTTVTDVKDNQVHYVENNFMTGENSEKVASLQEFDRLQKHPSDRPAAAIQQEASPINLPRKSGKKVTRAQGGPDTITPTPKVDTSDAARVQNTQSQDELVGLARKHGVSEPDIKDAIESSGVDLLRQKTKTKMEAPPPKSEPGESPAPQAAATDRVKVLGKNGWEEAKVLGREGDTLHVEIEDPIFGSRRTSVLESDTKPVASLQTPKVEDGGVPFKDIKGAANQLDRADEPYGGEGGLLGSVYEGHGPAGVKKTIKGSGNAVLSIEEGLKKLPPEAATIIGQIFSRIKAAAGKDINLTLAEKMIGAKGGMYELSGRVSLNLQWINQVVRNWTNMSDATRSNALMRVAALFGHEVTHVAQKFGERSGLAIDGEPLLKAINKRVGELSEGQRMYIAEQIKAAKGEMSGGVSKYLAGDLNAVYGWYKRLRPNLTREQAVDLASGEFMAEVGAVELTKRMNVEGLPTGLRGAIDRFKQVLVNVMRWFADNGHDSGVAALHGLSDIANKMFDHLNAGSEEEMARAFPARTSTSLPSEKAPPVAPLNPAVTTNNTPLLKNEIARLGLRATVGAVTGGLVVPAIGGNQTSTAEGVLLGGIAGLFGPAIVKRLLSGNFPQEIADAIKSSKGNPIKTMAAILGNKSLRDMGLEARYGWTGEASTMSKMVRLLEREMNVNLDPKMKALIEEARGQGTMVLATVQDALDKIRWYKPNADTQTAVESYFTGKLSKDAFMKLMDNPELQTYGQSMIAAREGMTTLTQMFASGMTNSNFKDQLLKTADSYLGKFYSAYKEGKFNMEHFDAAKKDLMAKYPNQYTEQMADDILREHMREVQANRGMFGGRRGNSGQKIDSALMSRRLATEEEIEGQKVIVGGLEHDPYSADYLKEKGKLDWMEQHKITDAWRDWLGEYKNPTERLIYTFQKVHPSAISAKAFSYLDERINSNGLRFSYTPTGLSQARSLIESEMTKASHPDDVARLQNQLKELSGYGALPQGSAYGKLSGKWVDRFTRDEVNTYATPFKWMEQPILRSISSFNNLLKISRTALNPLTTVRNYLQLPMFALISKTMPGDLAEAYRTINKLKDDTYRTMLERHIIGADYVASELSGGPGHVLSGHMDSDIAVKLAKFGMDKALKFYQQPDLLLRAGAFISARRRFANEAMQAGEGKFASLQDAMKDSGVIDKATEFTNRYTMNYSAVPRIVKIGRQLPFINLFVSYTSEITRILKNLSMDAISPGADSAGRLHAITVLGGMAAIPAMLTATFEGNLSTKDRADWEKVKTLSPDYARGRFRLPTSRDAEGRFHYMDITNLLPADSYSQMIKSMSQGDYKAALAVNPIVSLQNTPLLNMATEQIAGEDLQSGRKIIDNFGRVREILKETLPPIVPPGYEGSRLINAFSGNDQGGAGLTNLRTGVQYKPSDVIANYLTGMKFGNVQLATVQRSAISDAQQKIQQQQTLLKDTLSTNVAQPEKDKAVANYKQMEQEIMLELHSKLGS